jgi:glutathione synthase/RimK-type ligase-like ATP-grasp enzyme
MKKIFAIYYEHDVELGQLYPKPEDRQYNEAVFDIRDDLAEKGIDLILLTPQNSYVGNGQFSSYYQPIENFHFKEVKELIKPDLIFDKGHIDFNDGCLKFFNSHDFARLGRNKYTQAVIAEGFVPRTELVCSEKDYETVLKNLKTDKIVAKPLGENGGNGVTLFDRNNLSDNKNFPVIMQEFVETSGGIDGMVGGRHDIRLYIIDGEAVMCSIRQPKEGGWLSNTHQGGSIHFYNKSEINPDLLEFAKPLIEKFDQMGGKFYAVDFMHGNDGWHMVEMNDRPGMPARFQDTNGAVSKFHEKLTNMILKELA